MSFLVVICCFCPYFCETCCFYQFPNNLIQSNKGPFDACLLHVLRIMRFLKCRFKTACQCFWKGTGCFAVVCWNRCVLSWAGFDCPLCLLTGFTASPTQQNSRGLNVDFDSVFGNNTNANHLDATGKCCSPTHRHAVINRFMSKLKKIKVLVLDLSVCVCFYGVCCPDHQCVYMHINNHVTINFLQ